MNMGKAMTFSLLHNILVSLFVAYIACHALQKGAHYLEVFRIVGTSAFLAYSGAVFVNSIWFHHKWNVTLKTAGDGLLYALLTAGVFGAMWPGA